MEMCIWVLYFGIDKSEFLSGRDMADFSAQLRGKRRSFLVIRDDGPDGKDGPSVASCR